MICTQHLAYDNIVKLIGLTFMIDVLFKMSLKNCNSTNPKSFGTFYKSSKHSVPALSPAREIIN